MTPATPPDLREALAASLRNSYSRAAMKAGSGVPFMFLEDPQGPWWKDADALIAGPLADLIAENAALRTANHQLAGEEWTDVDRATLEARIKQVEAERDAALKTMEMCATSGAFHAKHAENATARADALERAVTGLGEGIQAFLDGDYENPRSHRPMPCQHGVEYWNECSCCNEDHFQTVLRQARTALAQQEKADV